MGNKSISVTPSAARLTSSLRDIGYDFISAVADLVDNSIAANAKNADCAAFFLNWVATDQKARDRLVATYDHNLTTHEWATGYRWDIVLTGSHETPFETSES